MNAPPVMSGHLFGIRMPTALWSISISYQDYLPGGVAVLYNYRHTFPTIPNVVSMLSIWFCYLKFGFA